MQSIVFFCFYFIGTKTSFLEVDSKIEIFERVVERDIFDHLSEKFHVGRNLTIFDIVSQQITKRTAEIFVTGIGEEASRIGQHSDKTA